MNEILQTIDTFLMTPEGFMVCMILILIVIALIFTIFDQWGDKDWAQREWDKIQKHK